MVRPWPLQGYLSATMIAHLGPFVNWGENRVGSHPLGTDLWQPRSGHRPTGKAGVRHRLLDAPQAADGTRRLEITRDELARWLGIDWAGTVGEWLKSEPIPGRKGWRRIAPKDEASQALAHFIPRLRYTYERGEDQKTRRTGLALYIRMDEPLTPEDEARLPDVVAALLQERLEQAHLEAPPPGVKKGNPTSQAQSVKAENSILHPAVKKVFPVSQPGVKSDSPVSQGVKGENPTGTLTNELDLLGEIEEEILSLDFSLTDGRRIRGQITPIVKAVEEALADYHSTQMLYKVLTALYRAGRLDLFVQALGVAVEVGEMDAAANLGAVFVSEIKRLGQAEGVGVGLAGSSDRPMQKAEEERGGQGAAEDPPGLQWGNGQGVPSIPEFSIRGCPNSRELWDKALKELALQMTRATFDTWLLGTFVVDYEPVAEGGEGEDRFLIQARSAYAVDWLTNRLMPTIVRTLSRLVRRSVRIEFIAGKGSA
jgi:hypothetical protein